MVTKSHEPPSTPSMPWYLGPLQIDEASFSDQVMPAQKRKPTKGGDEMAAFLDHVPESLLLPRIPGWYLLTLTIIGFWPSNNWHRESGYLISKELGLKDHDYGFGGLNPQILGISTLWVVVPNKNEAK